MSWKLCTLADAFLIFQFECNKINFTLFRDYLSYWGVWSDIYILDVLSEIGCSVESIFDCEEGASCQNKLSNLVGGSVCIIGFYYPGEILWPLSLAHGWKEERSCKNSCLLKIFNPLRYLTLTPIFSRYSTPIFLRDFHILSSSPYFPPSYPKKYEVVQNFQF